MVKRLALGLAMVSLLVGCANGGTAAGTPGESGADPVPVEQVDGSWVVTALAVDGSTVELLSDWPITLDVADGRVSGRAPCNNYSGAVETDGSGGFSVAGVAATRKACLGPVMQIEQTYLAALERVDRAIPTGGLTLTNADTSVEIVLGAGAPTPGG